MRSKETRNGSTGTFTVDRAYFREQAREALRTFFAPLSGVYHAITDPSVTNSDKRA